MVLGWGPLSDSVTLKMIDLAQTDRRVLFKSYDPKLPDEEIESFTLNVHVIPADPGVEKQLGDIRAGHVVEVEGWLVEAVAEDGWRWRGEPRERAPAAPGNLLWLQRLTVREPAAPTPPSK